MFSVQQKREIAEKVQQILRDTQHPELPKGEKAMSNPSAESIDMDVWRLTGEVWSILRYKYGSPGSHKAKLSAAKLIQEFIEGRSLRTAEASR